MGLKKYIIRLRKFRVFHRYLGLTLAVLLIISALTGVLLALKKDIPALQPPTIKGADADMNNWKPLSELAGRAQEALISTDTTQQGNPIDRIDVRPTKGMVKVLFKHWQWEVQLDATTAEVLSVGRRHSDWIEALHDGSIISDTFKIGSMTFLGIGLLFLIATGFWLWYGPKQYRRIKERFHRSIHRSKIKQSSDP